MNTVNKNILTNYACKFWGFVSIILFIRLYIDTLGIQAYAIISFYTVILGLLAFADSGLTATLTRELAKESTKKHKSDLLSTFEKMYFVICVVVIVGVFLCSNYIASNFLQSNGYSIIQISYFIKLIGFGIGFQLFSTLYDAGLMALQKQGLLNKIRIDENLKKDDIHVMMFDKGCLLAYKNLVQVEEVINDKKTAFLGIGNICSKEKGKGLGQELLQEVNAFMEEKKLYGILLCKNELIGFYAKYHWVLVDKIILNEKLNGINVMLFNLNDNVEYLNYECRNF
ncbi:oligosaccharide flippase family protein [Flavobacterium psychrophilum]|uniref:lipopolysaccharide biosynthesis protein n=1 Tax=Flavobacterium psychrophilum TaxID=96345 RepID=UPI001D08CBEF|nr:oligosaccharide flippase family protein [Flavobacterium psychrophilum]ELV7524838.1 oligosaccharide flippase family protein [Flavobacterium psychrophilum]ELY1978111.1 oligosaccharide flippase family protein [Flavobacterium psychrophilum]ELY2016272.1 oligosaccharide flippase family protein [Flavobacterium psychrophilum]MCB6061240.1 oligosaccharide flippase family protein [Flavobacterium psychrophilum]